MPKKTAPPQITTNTLQLALEAKAKEVAFKSRREVALRLHQLLSAYEIGRVEPEYSEESISIVSLRVIESEHYPSECHNVERALKRLLDTIWHREFKKETDRLTQELLDKAIVTL